MNYRLLFIVSVLVGFNTITSKPNNWIDEFKHDLFVMQAGLVSNENLYYQFLDPYINEASRSLAIIRYALTESEKLIYGPFIASFFYEYKEALLQYNAAYFHAYSRGDFSSPALKQTIQKLYDSIVRFKKETDLTDLNVDNEFNKTIKLFQRANSAYYKSLPALKKLKIKIANMLPAVSIDLF